MSTAFQRSAFQDNAFQIDALLSNIRVYTIDPVRLPMKEWFDVMSMQMEPLFHPPILIGEEWKSWALRAVVSPKLSIFCLPNPEQYSDWHEWAKSFNRALSTAGF